MSETRYPTDALMDYLGAMSAKTLANKVLCDISLARKAITDGTIPASTAMLWCADAGIDPSVVWPIAPIDVPVVDRATGKGPPVPGQYKDIPIFPIDPNQEFVMSTVDRTATLELATITLPRGELLRLEFADELPPQRRTRSRHFSWSEALTPVLTANAGRWLKLLESPNYKLAASRRKHLQGALGEGYEVAIRPNSPEDKHTDPHWLWVRHTA